MAPAVGIDFGTTKSVLSVFDHGEPTVVRNADDSEVTPSIVGFTADGAVLVGEAARRHAAVDPDRVIRSVKRFLDEDKDFHIDGRVYSAQDIASFVFAKLKRDAEKRLGERIRSAVIAVPASTHQRQHFAVAAAAQQAGLSVQRILYESTAAAMAYGFYQAGSLQAERSVLVFDLGGGTLDVSLVVLADGLVEVKSTYGDSGLGGDDWDRRVLDHLVATTRELYGAGLAPGPWTEWRLRATAEKVKIALSDPNRTQVSVRLRRRDDTDPADLPDQVIRIDRTTLEHITRDLLDRCRRPVARVLQDTGISADAIDHLVLVGGSTRMPSVAGLVEEMIGKKADPHVNRDHLVAAGAAVQAAVLGGTERSVLLCDVVPHSVGIETQGGIMHQLVRRNAPVPTAGSHAFTTTGDGQTSALIQIYQGEREMAASNRKLGTFELDGIAAAPRGAAHITVTVDIDKHGVITVAATDLTSGRSRRMTITRKPAAAPASAGVARRDGAIVARR